MKPGNPTDTEHGSKRYHLRQDTNCFQHMNCTDEIRFRPCALGMRLFLLLNLLVFQAKGVYHLERMAGDRHSPCVGFSWPLRTRHRIWEWRSPSILSPPFFRGVAYPTCCINPPCQACKSGQTTIQIFWIKSYITSTTINQQQSIFILSISIVYRYL